MYLAGCILLGLGIALLGVSNPWKFFDAIEGSFFDWTEVFWYLQWTGFWLVAASLAAFARSGCRTIPPAMALVIAALFFAFSMPEKSNQRDWKNGWLGLRVYVRTKMWLREDGRGESVLPDRLAGRWESDRFVIAISHDAIRIGDREWNANTCRHRFQMEYDFTFRQALERPSMAGLRFAAFHQNSAHTTSLPDWRFPRLSCSCDAEFASFVLVDIDRLMVFVDSDRHSIARRR